MLYRVRQGLLDEPEDGKLDTGRQVRAGAAAFVSHAQACGPDPAEQVVQVRQAGQRLPEIRPGAGPQHAEQAAGLGQRLPGSARHVPDRIGRLAGRAGDGTEGAVGKRHDHREVVGHAVVHLPGDTRPLLRRGQCAALVAFALEPLSPVAQLGEVGPASAHVQANDQDNGRVPGGVRDREGPVTGAILADHEDHDTGHQRRRAERRRLPHRGGDRVQADRQRDREQRPVGRPLRQDGSDQDRPDENRARPDPAQHQRQGGQAGDEHAGGQRQVLGVRRLAEREAASDAAPAKAAQPMSNAQERSGRVRGLSTGLQMDTPVSSSHFRCAAPQSGD